VRTLFHNARFWSGTESLIESILVENDRIVAINSTELDVDSTIDLAGAFVMPAFIDGHAHPIFGGREAAGPKINGLKSVEEIIAEVARYAHENKEEPWIIGGAYEAAIVEAGDFDAHWLDAAVDDRPVVLHAVDHHTIWVNTRALELAGLNKNTVDPVGGSISRRENGQPKGTLREPSAMALILDLAPPATIDSDIAAIKRACDSYLSVGVTAATDAWVEKDMARAYVQAARTGDLSISMNLAFLATPLTWRENVKEFKQLRAECENLPNPDLIKANTIKFLADGALSAGTAALAEPYEDAPESSGIKIWETPNLIEAIKAFDLQRFQVHIHAIGDAAVKQAFDAIEVMINENPLWDRRPVIAHSQLICDEDLHRFKELGVIANIQPLWCYLDPMNKELILPRIGHTRNNLQYRLRTLIDNGARIAFGSDWPVTSNVPLLGLAVPIHRSDPHDPSVSSWEISEALLMHEAVTFYTRNAAFQMFREDERGTLEVGKKADFLVLGSNPFITDPHDVSKIKINAVYQNGHVVS